MKMKYHFNYKIQFPPYEKCDTVTIPKKSDLMIGGNISKRRKLENWLKWRKMGVESCFAAKH